jgi:hypothetical protein
MRQNRLVLPLLVETLMEVMALEIPLAVVVQVAPVLPRETHGIPKKRLNVCSKLAFELAMSLRPMVC